MDGRRDLRSGVARRKRRAIKGAAVLAHVVALLAATVTGAFIAAAHGGGTTTFTRGNIDLSVSPASAAVSFDGVAPGDRTTAPLTVSNDGTMRLRYAVTIATTNAGSRSLARRLALTIKAGVVTCSDDGFGSEGNVLYGPGDLGSVTGISVVGDPAPGQQRGDRILDAGDEEVLCIRVALPSDTRNAFQGASTSATFELHAEPVGTARIS